MALMTLEEFGEVLKKKYPENKNKDSRQLAESYLKKNPVYRSRIKPEKKKEDKAEKKKTKENPSFYSKKQTTSGVPLGDIDPELKKQLEKRGMTEKIDELEKGAGKASVARQLPSTLTENTVKAFARPFTEGVQGIQGLVPGGKTGKEEISLGDFGVMKPAISLNKEDIEAGRVERPSQLLNEALGASDLLALGKAPKALSAIPKAIKSKAVDPIVRATKEGAESFLSITKKTPSVVKERVPKILKEVQEFGKPMKSPIDIAGEIAQGGTRDKEVFLRSLNEIDTKDVKTFKDLSSKQDDLIRQKVKTIDDLLDSQHKRLTSIDLEHSTKVGDKTVKTNFVEKALKDLQELYEKSVAPADLERVKQLTSKMDNEGLSLKDVNNLAREYGRVKSGFNLSGTPSTSVTKQGYENVRMGIKNTVRDLMPDEKTKLLDKQISELISSKELTDDMVEKVNKLKQKVEEKNLVEKLSKQAGEFINLITGGGLRQLLFTISGGRNQGFKTLNAIDLEERLPLLLKQLDEINNAKAEKMIIEKIETLVEGVIEQGTSSAIPKILEPAVKKK